MARQTRQTNDRYDRDSIRLPTGRGNAKSAADEAHGAVARGSGSPASQSRPGKHGARPESSGTRNPAPRERAACWAVSVLLVVRAVLVYAQTYRHDFVNIDDATYVANNPHLRHGLTVDAIVWAFSTSDKINWHPLTWLSLLLDAQCYGTSSAGGFLRTNFLLHAANAVLLFLLLRWMTGQLWPGALVAALFAMHPTRVESVAWVTERKDVLSGLFGMLTLWAYVWYTRSPNVVRYFLVVLALALGLLCKSILVTWPFVFLLLDYWPLRRPLGWQLLLEKAPLLLAAAGCRGHFPHGAGQRRRLLAGLCPASGKDCAGGDRLRELPGDLGLAGRFVALFGAEGDNRLAGRRRRRGAGADNRGGNLGRMARPRWLAVGWFWFLGTFVPTIGLVQVGTQVLADRFLYLPQIGLWMAVAWTAAAWVESRPRRWHFGRNLPRSSWLS